MNALLKHLLGEWKKQKEGMENYHFLYSNNGDYYKGVLQCKECGDGVGFWCGHVADIYKNDKDEYEFLRDLIPVLPSSQMKFCAFHLAAETVNPPDSYFSSGMFIFEPFNLSEEEFSLMDQESNIWYENDYNGGRLVLFCPCYVNEVESNFQIIGEMISDTKSVPCECNDNSIDSEEIETSEESTSQA